MFVLNPSARFDQSKLAPRFNTCSWLYTYFVLVQVTHVAQHLTESNVAPLPLLVTPLFISFFFRLSYKSISSQMLRLYTVMYRGQHRLFNRCAKPIYCVQYKGYFSLLLCCAQYMSVYICTTLRLFSLPITDTYTQPIHTVEKPLPCHIQNSNSSVFKSTYHH